MKMNRQTARALVDANLMPLADYIEMFGSTPETEAGKYEDIKVTRVRRKIHPEFENVAAPHYGFLGTPPKTVVARPHCH